jgi:hypothetical protein
MKPNALIKTVALCVALAGTSAVMAQDKLKTQDKDQLKTQDKDQLRDQDKDQLRDQDPIYGYELMTDQERLAYRERMRSAKTMQERLRIREEHRLLMEARAKERGVQIMHANPAGPGGMGGTGGSGAGKKP